MAAPHLGRPAPMNALRYGRGEAGGAAAASPLAVPVLASSVAHLFGLLARLPNATPAPRAGVPARLPGPRLSAEEGTPLLAARGAALVGLLWRLPKARLMARCGLAGRVWLGRRAAQPGACRRAATPPPRAAWCLVQGLRALQHRQQASACSPPIHTFSLENGT